MDLNKLSKHIELTNPKPPLTIDEAMTRLGLKGFDEVERISKENGHYPKRSGRTTQMLLEAVIASQEEVVFISARTYDYAKDLASQARGLCVRLGLDPGNIRPISHNRVLGKVFKDHGLDY